MICRALSRGFIALLATLLVTSTIGCTIPTVPSTHPTYSHRPPPHAPAYVYHQPSPPRQAPAPSYRQQRKQDHELVYDKKLDLYVVVGHPQHYFHDGQYYRYAYGKWQQSPQLEGPWKTTHVSALHSKLRQSLKTAKHYQHRHHKTAKHHPHKHHRPARVKRYEHAKHHRPKDHKRNRLEKQNEVSPAQNQLVSRPYN